MKLPQRVDGKAPPRAGQLHPVDRELRMAGDREFEHLGPLVARRNRFGRLVRGEAGGINHT